MSTTNDTPAPAAVKAKTYDGNTFCDIAGCPDAIRFVVRKHFPEQVNTLKQWVAALAAIEISVELPK